MNRSSTLCWWKPLTDGRRKHANDAMAALGRGNADADHLTAVLSVPPVLADDTTYTAAWANALPGTYRTLVRTHEKRRRDALSPNELVVRDWLLALL